MDSVLKFLIKLQADGGNVLAVARQTTAQLDAINRRAHSVGRSLRNAFSLSGLGRSIMSIPGMELLTNPYVLAGSAIAAITKIGAEAEDTATSFEVLVGSADKAASLLKEIDTFAAKTPFDKLNLTKAAQTMLSFGVASSDVMKRLKQLGDISGGESQKLQSLALVYGQVTAAGKLNGQDLRQFIDAGFNPLKELQAMTGKSFNELQDLMSKGAISAENVAQAMAHATENGGKFYGMMEKRSQTLSGKWSTLVDTIMQRAIGLYQRIEGPLKALLDGVNAIIPPIAAGIGWIFDAVVRFIGILVEWRTEIGLVAAVVAVATVVLNAHRIALLGYSAVQAAVTVATKAWAAAQAVLNVVMSANPIGLIIIGISALIAIVVYCWNKFAGFRAFLLTMWDVIKGLGNIIKTFLIDRIKDMLSGLGDLGRALLKLFSGDFKGAADSAVSGLKKISGVDATLKAAGSIKKLATQSWQQRYREESQKQAASSQGKRATISTPGQKGSATEKVVFGEGDGKKKKKGRGGKNTADALATGGTRNTSITMNIGKFFDNINVYMNDKTDTAELERIILQSINRSLAIATSTER